MIDETLPPTREARLLAQVYEFLLHQARLRKLMQTQVKVEAVEDKAPLPSAANESALPQITTDEGQGKNNS